mgnify:FL=1
MYKIQKTKFYGLFIIKLDYKSDERGYFVKNFRSDFLKNNKLNFKIKEINISYNKLKGTLRGMHYQSNPFSETKIVQCLSGKIHDMVIDLRKKSPTYGRSFSYQLSEDDGKLIFIPKGFAHGYQTLKPKTLIQYYVDQKYNKKYESGIYYDDPEFALKWPLKVSNISKKDLNWKIR